LWPYEANLIKDIGYRDWLCGWGIVKWCGALVILLLLLNHWGWDGWNTYCAYKIWEARQCGRPR